MSEERVSVLELNSVYKIGGPLSSFPRKRESRFELISWIPARASFSLRLIRLSQRLIRLWRTLAESPAWPE
jgi:hypothetical protein